MARRVAIVGEGQTPCKSRWVEKTYWGLAQMGVESALKDAGISINSKTTGNLS